MNDIPIDSRWRDREAGGRVVVVAHVRAGRVEWYIEADHWRVPWFTDRDEFTLWGRFERVASGEG